MYLLQARGPALSLASRSGEGQTVGTAPPSGRFQLGSQSALGKGKQARAPNTHQEKSPCCTSCLSHAVQASSPPASVSPPAMGKTVQGREP